MKTYQDIYEFPLHKSKYTSWVFDKKGNFVFQFEPKFTKEGEFLEGWKDFEDKILDCLNGKSNMNYDGVFTLENGEIFAQKTGINIVLHIITIRGWGNLTGIGAHHLSAEEATNIQDTFAEFIINKLNNKS